MRALVTVGLPGCGKSTWAATLGPQVVELNMDDFRAEVSGDAHNQEATRRAFWRRERRLEALAREGRDVVLSDTHAKRRDRTRVIRRLRELGYAVTLVFFNIGEETCRARNLGRARPVPEPVIARMANLLRGTPPQPHEADDFAIVLAPGDRLLED